jgi:hypothetical protein
VRTPFIVMRGRGGAWGRNMAICPEARPETVVRNSNRRAAGICVGCCRHARACD